MSRVMQGQSGSTHPEPGRRAADVDCPCLGLQTGAPGSQTEGDTHDDPAGPGQAIEQRLQALQHRYENLGSTADGASPSHPLPAIIREMAALLAEYRNVAGCAVAAGRSAPPREALWRIFELEAALGRSATAQQNALDQMSGALLPTSPLAAVNHAWKNAAEALRSGGYERPARTIDSHRCRLLTNADWAALLHLGGPMVKEFYDRDRPLARTLFAGALRAMERNRNSSQLAAVLIGLLTQEGQEGRWELAEMALNRIIDDSFHGEPLPAEVQPWAVRVLASRQKHLTAAESIKDIIARKETRLQEGPDDDCARELPDDYFMLVCQYSAAGRIREAETTLERAESLLDADRIANLHHLIGVRERDLNPPSPRRGSHFRYILRVYPKTHWAALAARELASLGHHGDPRPPARP